MTDRILWFDVARGISILLVVIYHVLLLAGLGGIDIAAIYDRLNAPIQIMRMPLFFTVSALLLARMPARPWPEFLTRYIWPTAWLFLLWNTVYVLLAGRAPVEALSSIWDLGVLSTHLWFLWALVAYRLLGRAFDGLRIPALAIAAAVSLYAYHGPVGGLSFVEKNLMKYAAFFLFALWYGRPVAAFITARPALCLAISLVAGAVCWAFYIRSGVAAFGVAGICAGSVLIADRLPLLRRALAWPGRHTLEIFLLHFMLIPPLLWIAVQIPGHSWWAPLGIGLVATVVPVWLRRISEGWAPWLYRPPHRLPWAAPRARLPQALPHALSAAAPTPAGRADPQAWRQ